MLVIKQRIREVLEEINPMTIRQLFYQLTSRGVIEKTAEEYKGTVVRLLTSMRLDGEIPYEWIIDNTRYVRKPESYNHPLEFLLPLAGVYRRDLWKDLDVHVEFWCEKDALAALIYEVTEEFDVALLTTRGYPSLSFLKEAAERLESADRPCYLFYLGDYDPSGVDIPRHTEMRLRELAPGAEIKFECVAILPWQIEAWSLPTRPTSKKDSRKKGFDGESVELDSLTTERLQSLVRECIERHIDEETLAKHKAIEKNHQSYIDSLVDIYVSFDAEGNPTVREFEDDDDVEYVRPDDDDDGDDQTDDDDGDATAQ